jgi:23S rRNA pseudouridine2605 synthase
MRPPRDRKFRRKARNAKPNSAEPGTASRRVGLARALSKLGFCSRARAAELAIAGRVKLNGIVRRDPETPVRPGIDSLEVDGAPVQAATKTYLMLNKPRGVVTTAAEEKNRETVYAWLPDSARSGASWLAPVGRLDKASEGLLLFTNDSEWAARITAPETHLDKTYHVQITTAAADSLLDTLKNGVSSEGELLRAKRAGILRHGDRNSWLEIVLDEGKNRQIRRMLSPLGIEVLRLIRVAIGPLLLGDLPKGVSRQLTSSEKSSLDQAMRTPKTS